MTDAPYDLFTGIPPHQAHSPTSRAAAERATFFANNMRAEVYRFINARGLAGATDCEIQEGLGMNPNTERPRRRELELAGHVHDSGEKRPTSSGSKAVVWHAIRAQSRAEGIENIKAVNGIRFYVIADAYRAAREEDPDWPRGSDAGWARETGIQPPHVSTLSQLWETGKLHACNFGSWAEARQALDGPSTTVTVDGEDVEAEVLPPEPARWSSKRARILNEIAEAVSLKTNLMLEEEFPALRGAELTIVRRKFERAKHDISAALRRLKKGGPDDAHTDDSNESEIIGVDCSQESIDSLGEGTTSVS